MSYINCTVNTFLDFNETAAAFPDNRCIKLFLSLVQLSQVLQAGAKAASQGFNVFLLKLTKYCLDLKYALKE